MSSRALRIAVGQLTSTASRESNFETCSRLVKEAVAAGAQMLCLPECFDFVGKPPHPEPLDGPRMQMYQNLAKSSSMWLSLGGFHELIPSDTRISNTHVMVNDLGEIVSIYRKIHLFDVDTDDGVFHESSFTRPGSDLVVYPDSPYGAVALTVCYDLRFPCLYRALRNAGAKMILVPAAFMPSTGAAHWEVLLRARAIETQCYVVAAAQAGRHNPHRASYGHSMIIDPWGKIVAEMDGESTGICVADIDLPLMESVRKRLPVHMHQRPDLYTTTVKPTADFYPQVEPQPQDSHDPREAEA
eukprot:TRINITY_DN5463_c0_g1::TRINITY_DN5463_c0_g1_i1::g.26662::m.26662 TRINITY_DN5463_c0_g1::TRINITY_DN5463_c0_g1_i1::g.26662  ORF type:complete len:300 (-),score=25.31,sp/Q94JV5/NILP2_ARATH/53.87/2e-96,CN_hydrolase/PF00795.17/1.2e-20,CN_hydrolase/PF00795.17/1.7e+02 TRINITY_DN5463_c0_g1_i1:289-1188(-)